MAVRKPRLRSSKKWVGKLLELVEGRKRVVILMHDNPDPDAMAGGLGLSHLIEQRSSARPRIVYGGVIGRADNRNMVRLLELPLWSLEELKLRPRDAVVLVDSQPGFGNNSLPDDCNLVAVIDHHPGGPHPAVPLVDVRPAYGAVASIVTEYLAGAALELPSRLATALCYAIGTETQDLGREASPADIAAFMSAFPAADQPLVGRLRHPKLNVSFFAALDRAIRAAQVAEGVLVCPMGRVPLPDTAAGMADMLIAVQGVEWVMCTSVYEDSFVVSVRTSRRDGRAGELLRRVFGERSRAGGHGMIAGGRLEMGEDDDPAEVHSRLTRGFLEEVGLRPDAAMRPLLDEAGLGQPERPDASAQRKR